MIPPGRDGAGHWGRAGGGVLAGKGGERPDRIPPRVCGGGGASKGARMRKGSRPGGGLGAGGKRGAGGKGGGTTGPETPEGMRWGRGVQGIEDAQGVEAGPGTGGARGPRSGPVWSVLSSTPVISVLPPRRKRAGGLR